MQMMLFPLLAGLLAPVSATEGESVGSPEVVVDVPVVLGVTPDGISACRASECQQASANGSGSVRGRGSVGGSLSVRQTCVERALDEVERLFARSGIRWRWRLVRARSPLDAAKSGGALAEDLVTVVVSSRPSRIVVSGCSRNRHDHRLGTTELGTGRITVWTEQVARAVAGDWDSAGWPAVNEERLATALGRVLAHELGHLFLQLGGHQSRGLMRASFSFRTLTGRSDAPFRLRKEDFEHMRASIHHLQSPVVD